MRDVCYECSHKTLPLCLHCFQCKGLETKDIGSPSDPMILVDMRDANSTVFTRLGATECIKDNNNPVFTKQVDLEYIFEKKQMLRFTVLDVDDFQNLPTEYTANVR